MKSLRETAADFLDQALQPKLLPHFKEIQRLQDANTATQQNIDESQQRIQNLSQETADLQQQFTQAAVEGGELDNVSAKITDNKTLVEHLNQHIASQEDQLRRNRERIEQIKTWHIDQPATIAVEALANEIAGERAAIVQEATSDLKEWDAICQSLMAEANFEYRRNGQAAQPPSFPHALILEAM